VTAQERHGAFSPTAAARVAASGIPMSANYAPERKASAVDALTDFVVDLAAKASATGLLSERETDEIDGYLQAAYSEIRSEAANDVHRDELPTIPVDETPEIVAKTVRAVDVRLAAQGAEAPYGVAQGGEPR
jgi:hypothetical protein